MGRETLILSGGDHAIDPSDWVQWRRYYSVQVERIHPVLQFVDPGSRSCLTRGRLAICRRPANPPCRRQRASDTEVRSVEPAGLALASCFLVLRSVDKLVLCCHAAQPRRCHVVVVEQILHSQRTIGSDWRRSSASVDVPRSLSRSSQSPRLQQKCNATHECSRG